MGFYDLRCALTGLSLRGQTCDTVLLRRREGRPQPIWGTIRGPYNRLGSIDDPPRHAAELAHLREAIERHVLSGRWVERGDTVSAADPFFERFEPSRHVVQLDGDELSVRLVHHRIVQHLEREHAAPTASSEALFARVFARIEPFAPYAPLDLDAGLRRLEAIRAWLGARPFLPVRMPEQHTDDDVARSIRDAKKRAPALREAIEEAETQDY